MHNSPMDLPACGTLVQCYGPSGLLVPRVTVARSFFRRLRGRLGTTTFADGDGLLLAPCSEIHMLGMRYPLDIVFLDRAGIILATRSSLPPGTLQLRCPGAFATLELPPGTLDSRWAIGRSVSFHPPA